MSELEGRIAIVTGAASGIGRAGAELMAAAGALVVAADIDEAGVAQVAAGVEGRGGQAVPCRVDVRDVQSVRNMVDSTVEQHGRIDALFHNAVSVPLINKHDNRVTELDDDIWDQIIGLVLTGTYYCAKYTCRHMLRQGAGSIILTATVDALIGQAGIDAYTAAKGGVVSLTRSLAAGVSPEGVRVNAICPGFVDTPHQAGFLSVPEERAKLEALHLMPILEPEDIANFAVYLASDRARHMTGGIHVVDGQGHEDPGRVQADVGGGDGEGGIAGLELAPVVVLDAGGGQAKYVAVEARGLVDVGSDGPDEVDGLDFHTKPPWSPGRQLRVPGSMGRWAASEA